MEVFINNIYDKYFRKTPTMTGHEGLFNEDSISIAGFIPAVPSSSVYYTHINYHTMKQALISLVENNPAQEYYVVETGCAAHGTKSTLLWDKFVNSFGGEVNSVDLDEKAVNYTNSLVSKQTKVTCSDSLVYLPTLTRSIDFLYLDSYDVDFLNPLPSAEHHLKEFLSVKHLLHKGSVVLIDDTPVSPEWLDGGVNSSIYSKFKEQFNPRMTGKGSLVADELEIMGAKKIMHQYQMLWVV